MPEDDFIACANTELESSFGEGSVEGEVVALEFENIGDQTEGFGSAEGHRTAHGEVVTLQVAFVAIRTGDLVTGLKAIARQALDSDVLDSLGERIVEPQERRVTRLAVVGGGRMGEGLVSGLLSAGWARLDITVVEVSAERRATLGDAVPASRWPPRSARPTARSSP